MELGVTQWENVSYESDPNFTRAVEICKAAEISEGQMKTIVDGREKLEVHSHEHDGKHGKQSFNFT